MKKANLEKIELAEGSSFHMSYNKAPLLCHTDFWHFHPEFEIVYVPHGKGKRFVGDKISGFAEGDLVLLGPNIPHNAFNFGYESADYEEYVIQFRSEHMATMTDSFPEFSRVARLLEHAQTGIAVTGEAKHRIGQLIKEMYRMNCFQRLMQLFFVLREMSLLSKVEDLQAKKFLSVDTVHVRRVGMVYRIIQRDYQQELSTRQVAGELAMTESSFCRWFKKITGKSFKQALTEVRIQKACALLTHSDQSVASVASMAGFNNISLFNRFFKEMVQMTPNKYRRSIGVKMTIVSLLLVFLFTQCAPSSRPVLDKGTLATTYFGEDKAWYLDNIPFFECSDQQMEQVYYYRWKLYKAHIRNTGPGQHVITEFIDHVAWDRDPYCTINAASMHHIYEGRWLKDPRYIDDYIKYLFQDGGNNRHYSESIADAAYADYLVHGDTGFMVARLDSMILQYNAWSDHFDSSRQLYFIPAMPDATEYTIASVDASGGKDGFDDGEAYRPTINSYMYGNALAIARVALLKGDTATAGLFLGKARALKDRVTRDLWNDSLHHFTDRFKVDNQYVHRWDFIRGRELAGMIPWYFDLPPDSVRYNVAWLHVLDTTQLLGQYGLRTNEPSYQYYFKQFVFYRGQRGSQWNGPSWPYQTSQVLTGMANLLNDYQSARMTMEACGVSAESCGVMKSDYVKLLRLYTRQHYLPNGKINLVEDYDPNNGTPIVYYYWSNHYNHSSYNNLIISGLCGVRPSAGDTLVIHPLVDSSIRYFCLDDVSYHGHAVTVVYDRDGVRYQMGKGLTVLVDGVKTSLVSYEGRQAVVVGGSVDRGQAVDAPNYALNIRHSGYPQPSASVNAIDSSLYQAIDGRIWYFPEITNRWTTTGSTTGTDWYQIDFEQSRNISKVKLYLFADGETFDVPDSARIEYQQGDSWMPVKETAPVNLTANTGATIDFEKVTATRVRVVFTHKKAVALVEMETF